MSKRVFVICLLLNSFGLLLTQAGPTEPASDVFTTGNFDASNFEAPAGCDITAQHGICINNGEKRIFADARPDGLIMSLGFNEDQCLDNSGCQNDCEGKYYSGPAMGGNGYSAALSGRQILTVPNSHWFDSDTFSLTFWIFLTSEIYEDPLSNAGLRYCPIIYKGIENDVEGTYERAPAIFIDRELRSLTVYVSTTSTAAPQGEYVSSNAQLPYERWTHVALIRVDKRLRLYINGIMDSVNTTAGSTVTNQQPLYIGNTPWAKDECAVPMFFDNFRYYTRELSDNEIQAEASPALGYVQPNFIVLGCMNCPLSQAAQTCIVGYHLCTNIEIHTAGYQVAKSLGWINWDSNIWTYNALKTSASDDGSVGLGLCCLN